MDALIESIAKLLPFESWGMKRERAEPLSIILLLVLTGIASLVSKQLIRRIKDKRPAIKAIMPQFDWVSIKRARQYFVPTQYQNVSPARQDEPGFTHLFVATSKLIPFFIKTAFNARINSERFYLVLGDSGMGKTTFLINLYLQYQRLFNWHRRLKMRLYRMSEASTLKHITAIPDEQAKETILLLDALDEDSLIYPVDANIPADKAFRDRVDAVISATSCFAIVVMTCRTQYLSGQEDDPYELKLRRADENGFYLLNKLYISPFTMREVRDFLRKRYGRFPWSYLKRRRAERIVAKATNLVMRPMLLNYIDYLLEDDASYHNPLTIYEAMVRNWLKREAAKRKNKTEEQAFIHNLDTLSRHVAVEIYRKWRSEHRLWLSREEALQIAIRFKIDLDPQEITGQSLLTCDGSGNWKFAHRSIMEYFLAKELELQPEFLSEFSFDGQDMVKEFYSMYNPFMPVVPPPDSSLQPFYLQSKLVYDEERDIVRDQPYKYGSYSLFTLEEAIEHCNRLNYQAGFPAIDGRWVVAGAKGYRLPTPEEINYISDALDPLFELNVRHKTTTIPDGKTNSYPTGQWVMGPDGIYINLRYSGSDGVVSFASYELKRFPIFAETRPAMASVRLVFVPK